MKYDCGNEVKIGDVVRVPKGCHAKTQDQRIGVVMGTYDGGLQLSYTELCVAPPGYAYMDGPWITAGPRVIWGCKHDTGEVILARQYCEFVGIHKAVLIMRGDGCR